MQEKLLQAFAYIGVIGVVMCLIYSYMSGLSYMGDSQSTVQKYSFGNMGYARKNCAKDLLDFYQEDKVTQILI
jgi:hypothetical protein